VHAQRKSQLDIFPFTPYYLGIYRDPFDRVVELGGVELTPGEGAGEVWEFRNLKTGQRGRLLDVSGFLSDGPMALSTKGRAYTVTRQDFSLALLFPGAPRRIRMNSARFRVLEGDKRPALPAHWPGEMITRVIRVRYRTIVILDEVFLLRQIGLRGPLHTL
jgi:hypothetical protein